LDAPPFDGAGLFTATEFFACVTKDASKSAVADAYDTVATSCIEFAGTLSCIPFPNAYRTVNVV